MRKQITYFAFVIVSVSIAQVTVVEDSLFSPSINTTMKLTSVLPKNYYTSAEKYLTVYLLHGFNGDRTAWSSNSDLSQYAERYRFILILPDAHNSWYANSPAVTHANYEDYVINDLIPFIDKKYRTVKMKSHRAVAGYSMGGYGAAKFGIKYPHLFFFTGCLSPAIQFPYGMEDSGIVARRSKASNESVRKMFGFPRNETWKENDVFMILEKADVKKLPYFYLSVGSQDVIPEIITLTHTFAEALRKKGAGFEMHEYPGAHNWKLWNKEIETVLLRISEISSKK